MSRRLSRRILSIQSIESGAASVGGLVITDPCRYPAHHPQIQCWPVFPVSGPFWIRGWPVLQVAYRIPILLAIFSRLRGFNMSSDEVRKLRQEFERFVSETQREIRQLKDRIEQLERERE